MLPGVRGIRKGLVVPSIMYGVKVFPWSAGDFEKLEVMQNKIVMFELEALRMVGMEIIRDEMVWSTFEERILKSALKYKVRLENVEDSKWARNIYIMTFSKSILVQKCVSFISRCGLERVNILIDQGPQPTSIVMAAAAL